MYKNVYTQIAEFLDAKLGREATDLEIEQFLADCESRYYDNREAEMKGN